MDISADNLFINKSDNYFIEKLTRTIYPVAGRKISLIGWSDRITCTGVSTIQLIRELLPRKTLFNIYDPGYFLDPGSRELIDSGIKTLMDENLCGLCNLEIQDNPYEAMNNARVVIMNLEWEDIRTYNWHDIYSNMMKPAYLFGQFEEPYAGKMEEIGFILG